MSTHATFRSRPPRAFTVALAIVTLSLLAAAPRASAQNMACNYDSSFNACLTLHYKGFGWYDGRVGIDVHMPDYYARGIVNCGNSNFKASLWGEDGRNDQFIRNFVLAPGWPAAGTDGLGAELYTLNLNSSTDLDEDDGTDRDELYAKVSYFDCQSRLTNHFTTGIIAETWW